MTLSLLTSICLLSSVLATPAPPIDQGTSQPLDTIIPVHPFNLTSIRNLTSITNLGGHRDMGCFKDPEPTEQDPNPKKKNWAVTNKADCEGALDSFVNGQQLGISRLWTKRPSSYLTPVQLPVRVTYRTCSLWINVVNDQDEEIMPMAELYAEVMGPNGLAKTCLGQHFQPAMGGRMELGQLNVVLQGVKQSATS